MDGTRPRKTDRFLAESSRRRISPLPVVSVIGGVLLAAWIVYVFLPKPLPPAEWWEARVEPALSRLREAEGRGEWAVALGACDEAIGLAQQRRDDFTGRLAGLRSKRKEIERAIALEAEAARELEPLRRKTTPLRAAAPASQGRYTLARGLLLEARPLAERFSGTRLAGAFLEEVAFLESVEPPQSAAPFPRAALDEALRRKDYAAALLLIEAHLRGNGDAADRPLAESQRRIVESRAREEWRPLKEKAGAASPRAAHALLCDARERFRGTEVEQEFEEMMSRLARPR